MQSLFKKAFVVTLVFGGSAVLFAGGDDAPFSGGERVYNNGYEATQLVQAMAEKHQLRALAGEHARVAGAQAQRSRAAVQNATAQLADLSLKERCEKIKEGLAQARFEHRGGLEILPNAAHNAAQVVQGLQDNAEAGTWVDNQLLAAEIPASINQAREHQQEYTAMLAERAQLVAERDAAGLEKLQAKLAERDQAGLDKLKQVQDKLAETAARDQAGLAKLKEAQAYAQELNAQDEFHNKIALQERINAGPEHTQHIASFENSVISEDMGYAARFKAALSSAWSKVPGVTDITTYISTMSPERKIAAGALATLLAGYGIYRYANQKSTSEQEENQPMHDEVHVALLTTRVESYGS